MFENGPRTYTARSWLGLGLIGLTIAAFVLDLYTPTGVADWLAYFVLSLGFLWLCGPRRAVFFTLVGSLLMLVGALASPPSLPREIALLNRGLGLVCMWSCLLASAAYARRSRELRALTDLQQVSLDDSARKERSMRANQLVLLEGLIGLRSFLTSSTDPAVVVDDEGLIWLASDSTERVFGYTPGELVGQNVSLLMPEPHRSAHDSYIERHHRTGESRIMGQARMLQGLRKDGTVFPLELTISRVENPGGRPWFTGLLRDVTERIDAERERAFLLESERSARLEAEHATRAKDEFLAMLSHELRTPLNAALGWVQILRRRTPDPETLREGLEAIERSTRSQAQLIADMLDMSRILSGKLVTESEPLVLERIAAQAVETLRPDAVAKGIRLDFLPARDPLAVTGDERRLQQVIWNLVSNALKFTPADGSVRVSLSEREGSAEIVVADTGVGIAAEFLPFVFDPFRQADSSSTRRHGGLGLGLALVKQLVGLHGGSVEAASPGPGQGATFRVRLPLAAPQAASVETPQTGTLSDPELSGLRILVVDDDAETCNLVRRMLAECRAEVQTANSAQAGLVRLDSFRPDVLVSDLSMPDMDGFQFLSAVRRLESPLRTTPALALSALARPEDRRKALESGFELHLAKPIERHALLAAVAELATLESVAPRKRKG